MLLNLNQEQKSAIASIDGSVLVIAAPGTGKTQILAARTAKMLSGDQGIDPYMILLLTFTEAGVKAMRERLIKFIGPEAYKLTISTFHGLCNDIIQSNPDYFGIRDFDPVSEIEQIEISYQIINEIPNESPLKRLRGDVYYDSKRFMNLWQLMKEESISPELLEEKIKAYLDELPNDEKYIYKRGNKKKGIEPGDPKTDLISKEVDKMTSIIEAGKLLPEYNRLLAEKKRYDYSDMLRWVYDAWSKDEFFLLNYQERYQYIMIDEFQDTNKLQFLLVDKLLDFWDQKNVFAVSDDDQCLYQFNGARIENILEFKYKYNSDVVVLIQNYRSTNSILNHATKLIDNNVDRLTNVLNLNKNMYSPNKGIGKEPLVLALETPEMEAAWITEYVKNLLNEDYNISNIGIIYRKHAIADLLIHQFEALGIPYNIKRSINVLDTDIVRQYLMIIKFINEMYLSMVSSTPLDERSFFKILHFPFLHNDTRSIYAYYLDKTKGQPDFIDELDNKIADCYGAFANMGLMPALNNVIVKFEIIDYLTGQPDSYKQIQYLNTFFNWCKGEVFKNPNIELEDLISLIDKMKDNGIWIPAIDIAGFSYGVNLMTAHGSKGLEFDKVIVMGGNRSQWESTRSPNTKYNLPPTVTLSTGENKLESSRRLFYVAMTRAMDELIITYPKANSDGKPLEPTQFISEAGLYPNDAVIPMNNYIENVFKNSILELDVLEEAIRDKLSDFSLSVSSMNKYLECPTKFYYENIVRVPFVAVPALISGNAVHISLKKAYDSFKETNKLDKDAIYTHAINYIQRNKGQLPSHSVDRMTTYVLKLLNASMGSYFESSNKITLTEYKIKKILIDGVPFKGDIDKMEFVQLLIDAVDYKTGNPESAKKKISPPTDKEPNGGEYWRQAVSYKIMIDNLYAKEWKFNSFRFDIITEEGVKQIPVDINYEDEIFVKALMKSVYNDIMALKFQGCGKPECEWCNMIK